MGQAISAELPARKTKDQIAIDDKRGVIPPATKRFDRARCERWNLDIDQRTG
jgi:hypothetical protein